MLEIKTVESPAMRLELSGSQKEARLRFRHFVQEHITPYAGQWDRDQRISNGVIDHLRARGYPR